MSTKNPTTRYLARLFDDDEHVCYTDNEKGIGVISVAAAREMSPPLNFISLNPLDGSQDRLPLLDWHRANKPRRADANVTSHRNLLIEFDGMSLEEQAQKLVDLEVPYTSLVYSGGKSLHAVIALTEGVTREEYDELFRYLKFVLWQCDPSCRNPSRLTRVAGADRDGVKQDLVDLRNRISKDRLVKWLSRFSDHIERCEKREQAAAEDRQAKKGNGNSGSDGQATTVSEATLAFLRGDITTTRSRHARLVAACFELQEAGIEYDQALITIEQACDIHGVTADPKRLHEGAQIVNYVYGSRKRSRAK